MGADVEVVLYRTVARLAGVGGHLQLVQDGLRFEGTLVGVGHRRLRPDHQVNEKAGKVEHGYEDDGD
jgi:hypothetical protein